MNRRTFLKTGSAAGLGFSAISVVGASKVPPTYTTALIGSGWWGMNILRYAIASGQSDVVALCDVDRRYLEPAADEVEGLTGSRPKTYGDYRELLSTEKPDIAIVATPDHWHPLIMIAAVESGAHVYVEKPIGHTINEGRAMVSAARKYGRVVQVGTHRRVSPHNVSGMEFLRSGKAGKIGMVRAFVHSSGGPGSPTPDEPVPEGLDWDMWCGPGPLRQFNPRIHPRGFREFLDYANGRLGDWGIHWMDQILWWTEEKYPKRVSSTGGRFVKQDNTDAPDTQIATFAFESFTASWEHRHYAGNRSEHSRIGCYFYGTEGVFHMGWLDGWTFFPRDTSKPAIHVEPTLHGVDNENIRELWADFLRTIESGAKPVCDIEIGHRSTNMSLLGMLSFELGRSLEWDGENERVVGDEEANQLLSRDYRAPWVYPRSTS